MKFAFVAAAAAATTISLPQEIMDELQGNIQERGGTTVYKTEAKGGPQ